MRVVSFITEGRVIRRILDHLDASARRATQDRAPPPAAAAPSAFALGGGGRCGAAPQALRTPSEASPSCGRESSFLSLSICLFGQEPPC
jgi:hypothetical protein